jgi:hypothetical protein
VNNVYAVPPLDPRKIRGSSALKFGDLSSSISRCGRSRKSFVIFGKIFGKLFDTALYLVNALADGSGEAIDLIGIRPAGL